MSKTIIQKSTKKVLINIFSREKSLIYFCVWNDSDRKGIQLIGEDIKNNLFLVPPIGQKGSVWYEQGELDFLKKQVVAKLKYSKNNSSWRLITKLIQKSWQFIKPYIEGREQIKEDKKFKLYYSNLVNFWTCLNSILYEVIDNNDIDKKIYTYLKKFRHKTEKYTEKMSDILLEYLNNHSELKDISYFITMKEAMDILNNKIKPINLKNIKQRINGCFMLNGNVYLYKQLKQTLKVNNLMFNKINTYVNKINGNIAFNGLARGKVKVINSFKDLNKIQNMDILVTQMTAPKYLYAIKKASAIVTDQGGTLCHASIIARELKKPCIIGTKIATQTLKDGDLVEVDANQGIIKILKKNKK